MSETPNRVCIIGAGSSGIAACKVLKEHAIGVIKSPVAAHAITGLIAVEWDAMFFEHLTCRYSRRACANDTHTIRGLAHRYSSSAKLLSIILLLSFLGRKKQIDLVWLARSIALMVRIKHMVRKYASYVNSCRASYVASKSCHSH